MLINQIISISNLHSHDQIDFEINAEIYSFKKELSYDLNIGSDKLIVWESIFDNTQKLFGNTMVVISLNDKFFAKIHIKDKVYTIDSTLVKNGEVPPIKTVQPSQEKFHCSEPSIINILPLEEIQKQADNLKQEETNLTITLSFALTQGFYDAYDNNIDSIKMDIAILLQYTRRTFYQSSNNLFHVNFIVYLFEGYATYNHQKYCYPYANDYDVFNAIEDGDAPDLVNFKYNTQADILIIGEQICPDDTKHSGGRANSIGIPDYDHSNIILSIQPGFTYRVDDDDVLAHEIGHLMGGVHPLAIGHKYDPQFFPGYGIEYRNPVSPDPNKLISALGTIMSGVKTQFDQNPSDPNKWLISWSSRYQYSSPIAYFPEELGGEPTGIEKIADVSLVMRINLHKLANMWENKDNK